MESGTILYEVLATVRDEIRASWELYMQTEHIPEVIEAGDFRGAVLERAEGGHYRIGYYAADRGALKRYLEDAAPAMRAASQKRFPDGVTLERAQWEVVGRW